MKRLISLLLLVAFTTAVVPANAFGPTPEQLENQYNNEYSPPTNQYGSFSPTPQQNHYSDYNSYNQNTSGSFSNTPQQGWGNTNPDGSFNVPQEYCSHWQKSKHKINSCYEEYNSNKHISYEEYEVVCYNCNQVIDSYVEEDYENHSFNSWNECSRCGYSAGCNHQWTSRQTAKYWYEVYDAHYHSEVYIEEEVCNYCGKVLDSQQKSKKWSHQYQYGRCCTCGYVQQTTSQPQYTSPVVNQPEYVEPEPEEEYIEKTVYVEQPQQNTNTQTNNLLPYQEALEQGRVYASTDDGLHLYKRNYAPNDYRGYEDKYYHTVKTKYDDFTLPAGEVFAQKGDYLYRHSDNGGRIIAAAPNIIKACDYRINELKNTLKGASDASTRIAMYKQVKRGQIPLSSISERNKRYLAQTGSSNSYVTRVQEALKGLGYTSQTISGILDSTTLNNIAYFQSQNGIYMTGWLDQETYDKITSRYTSYTNTQQIAARAPYVYLSNVHMEGKELVVTMHGNANTTILAVKLRYNGSVVSAEYFENANYGVAYLAPRESGIHYIEFFAKNAQGDIYEAPVQEININVPKGDGSTPLGITGAFCLGLGDSFVSAIQGVGGAILHPIKTIQSIGDFAGNLAVTVVDAGSVDELRNQAVDALTEIITITWNQLDNNTTEENARVTGKIVGDIIIAVLVTKGAEKGISALKDSANNGKLAQSVKGVINGTDSIDNAAMVLSETTVFYSKIDDGLNFTERASQHMQEAGRIVPIEILRDAIKYGDAMPDPQGVANLTMYYTTMFKNGKKYNLEVLYDIKTNTIFHFEYTQKPIGNLPAIKN